MKISYYSSFFKVGDGYYGTGLCLWLNITCYGVSFFFFWYLQSIGACNTKVCLALQAFSCKFDVYNACKSNIRLESYSRISCLCFLLAKRRLPEVTSQWVSVFLLFFVMNRCQNFITKQQFFVVLLVFAFRCAFRTQMFSYSSRVTIATWLQSLATVSSADFSARGQWLLMTSQGRSCWMNLQTVCWNCFSLFHTSSNLLTSHYIAII